MSRGRGAVQTSGDEPTVLALQGGGAPGAYQAGLYEALSANGRMPDRISGLSIGALELHHHALAPVADLPVLEVASGGHILSDLTPGPGEVAFGCLEGTRS